MTDTLTIELALYERNARWREEFTHVQDAAVYYGLTDLLVAHPQDVNTDYMNEAQESLLDGDVGYAPLDFSAERT